MLTSELIQMLCSDHLPKRSARIPLSYFFAVGVLTAISFYSFNAWHLSKLGDLVYRGYFQYLLFCQLLIYASSAKIFVALSRPRGYAGYAISMLAIGLLLLWIPVLLASAYQRLGLSAEAISLNDWLPQVMWMVLFALPWMVLLFMHLRFMAPIHLRLSGAMAGLVSGTLTAMLQLLSGKEENLSFYIYSDSFTMVLLILIGALLGSRWIRW
jgi:hypothetical protein